MYIVGIGGASASGKTSFIREVQACFPPAAISVLSLDNYYLPLHAQQKDENGEVNFDLPTALDFSQFLADLDLLREGRPVIQREYGFNVAGDVKEVVIQPAPIVIVEGLFVFHFARDAFQYDLNVFIDAPDDVKLARRISRDSQERGYTEPMVRYQWDNHVVPAYTEYLLPYKDEADLIVNNLRSYKRGMQVLVDHLHAKYLQTNLKETPPSL